MTGCEEQSSGHADDFITPFSVPHHLLMLLSNRDQERRRDLGRRQWLWFDEDTLPCQNHLSKNLMLFVATPLTPDPTGEIFPITFNPRVFTQTLILLVQHLLIAELKKIGFRSVKANKQPTNQMCPFNTFSNPVKSLSSPCYR